MIKNEPPEFALLEDGTLLYSYQKQVEEELFRAVLRAVDGEGRVRTLLELDQKKEDWDDPQPSRLISNTTAMVMGTPFFSRYLGSSP